MVARAYLPQGSKLCAEVGAIPLVNDNDGKVIAGTRTEAFIKAATMPAHLPLSGRTMEFDGNGVCQAGC